MDAPELTTAQRLMFANQYEILSKLDHTGQAADYAQLAQDLRDGHKWLYNRMFEWVAPVLDDAAAELVLNILGIYGDLKASFAELDDQSGIEAYQVEWPGFDGNNESDLLSFTSALIKAGRFEATLGKFAKNSHCPTVDGYTRMIARWQQLGAPRYPLSREQIVEILGAKR